MNSSSDANAYKINRSISGHDNSYNSHTWIHYSSHHSRSSYNFGNNHSNDIQTRRFHLCGSCGGSPRGNMCPDSRLEANIKESK